MSTVYIYTLKDPRNQAVRYVGKTNNPRKRLNDHCYEARKGRYDHKRCVWIRELLAEGLKPEMVIIAEVNVDEWEQAEQAYIADFSQNCDLLNMTEGGFVFAGK